MRWRNFIHLSKSARFTWFFLYQYTPLSITYASNLPTNPSAVFYNLHPYVQINLFFYLNIKKKWTRIRWKRCWELKITSIFLFEYFAHTPISNPLILKDISKLEIYIVRCAMNIILVSHITCHTSQYLPVVFMHESNYKTNTFLERLTFITINSPILVFRHTPYSRNSNDHLYLFLRIDLCCLIWEPQVLWGQ